MDEKQLQALFNEMKSKLELGDFATFKSQIGSDEKFRKAFYNEASVDLDLGDFNAFNESFKKKVSTTPSAKPAPVSAPVSPSKLPSPSALTYNDIELVIEDTRKKARRLQDLREAPMASAGIGAPGMVIPKTTLDQAAQELKLAEDKKKEVLTRYQGELSRPVERLIETGEYKSFFTKDGVFDEGKARDYFKKVTQKYGGGSHLQDQWLVNLKTRGQQEIDKPRFNQILGEEMKKNNLDLKQYSTQVFNQLTQEQRTTADSLKKERDAEALKLLNGAEAKAKQYADELNKAVNSLNDQIKAGVITNEEAAATYDQLVKQYETTIKGIDNGYKDAIRKMNVRINGKFDRIEQEVRAINSSIDSDKVMQSLPPDVRKRLETAYQAAGQRLSAEKNEARKKLDTVTGIGTTDVISRNINLALKSLTSGFNRGLAEVGEYLNMKGLSGSFVDVLRNRRTAAETFAPAQYEWNKDEWLKRAISSTGTSLGASVPILLPTIGAVALTGGGAAGALAAGALSFAGESAQIGGGQFREGLEETGDVVAATQRAEEVMRQNTITAPLYFIGGLGDVMITTGKGLSKVATGIALEQVEEIPTEYIQSFNEAKAKGYNKGIGDFIKENPEIAADTFISTIGQSGAMKGIASAFSVFQKNVPASTTQMLTDAVSKNGVEFTNSLIDKWFEAGKINQKTVAKLKAEVAKIQTQLPKMQEAGVDVEKAKLMSSLSSQSQELQNKINTEKDPAVKALYQNQLNVINQDISQLVKGETPYVVFTLPGGGDMTRVMTVREFNALPAESSNDMIKNSDGIKVVGDDALNTQLTQKKQELGVPEAAPGVFTQAPTGQELSITETITPESIEVSGDATEFANQMQSAQSSLGRAGMSVSPYTQEEYNDIASKGGQFFRAAGNKVLALLKPNGEMVSLVKDAGVKAKGAAQAMISKMKDMGGLFMDNYDIYLTSLYEKAGYKVVARVPFNEQFAPEGWDAADSPLKNKPDVVFMVRSDIAPDQSQNFTDYEAAQAYTQSVVDNAVNSGLVKLPTQIAKAAQVKPVADRLRTEIFGDTQQKVASAQKALEKTGVVIQMIEDPNEFDSKVTQLGGQRGMEGVFLSDTGEILINQQKLDQGIADGRVIWHEASHPVVNIVRNTNPQLFGQVVAGLRQAAADNKGVADALAWAESQYAQDGQGVVDDEAVVETIAGIAEGMIDISKLPTGLKQSIIDLINRIARALGLGQVLDDTDIAAFKKLASDVANALTTGQDVSQIVGEENIKATQNELEQLRKSSADIAKQTEDKTVQGAVQPSMVLMGKQKGQDVVQYSGPASIEDLKKIKPDMYVSRAVDLSKSALVQGKTRMFPSNASAESKLKWADSVYAKAKDTVVSNLLFLFDAIPSEIRDISKLWYDGANIIAQELAKKYNTTLEQAAGVMASQSPQKPWYDNVHLAHFIMDFYANKKDMEFTQEMYDYYALKSQPTKQNPAGYPKQIEYLPTLKQSIGKKFTDLSNYDRSVMIRADFDNNYERRAPLRIPTGEIVGRVSSMSSFSGYDTIAKGVSILENGSVENISDNLGKAFKVRNFNNNIADPKKDGEVTIDTHAMAAAYLLPLGASSPEVKFDEGTYAFFADAYREAAKQRGVLAREMQSIVWEGVRSVFPAAEKSEANKTKAKDIWSKYKDGTVSLTDVQNQIKENGKDLSITDWSRFTDTILEENRKPSYLEELPLAGRDQLAAGLGDGGRDIGGVPGMGEGGVSPSGRVKIQARTGRPVVGQIDWQRSPEGKGDPSISARSKVVTQAAAGLKDGKITNEEYRATVSENSPIMPITRFFEPATEAEVERSLDKNQAMKANTPVGDGTKVGLRLDIPAYKNNNTWVVSVHEGDNKAGKAISYRNVARITDVRFGVEPKASLNIAAGLGKAPINRIYGKWKNIPGTSMTEQAENAKALVQEIVDDPNYVQVGMNPFRHSYFYDRNTDIGRPIVSADEVIQVGGLVYAKNPVYGNWTDESYRVKGMLDAAGAPVQFSRGNRMESSKDFKLAAFVMREKADGAPLSEIVSGIASVFPNMSPQEIKDLVDDPETWLRNKYANLSKAMQDNLIARARVKNIYAPRTGAIAPAFQGLEVPMAKVEEATQAPTFKERVDKVFTNFKNKFIDPAKGLPDWIISLKDFAGGTKQIEISRAELTIRQLKEVAKKIGFKDWDTFSAALKSIPQPIQQPVGAGTGMVGFNPSVAAAGAPYTIPNSMLPQTTPPAVQALPLEIIPFVYKMRGQIDGLTKDLIASGYVTPEQAAKLEANIGQYVNRAYRLYNEKGWRPDQDQIRETTKFLADQYIKQLATDNAGVLTYEQIEKQAIEKAKRDVNEILDKKTNPYFAAKSESRNMGILRERKDIPEPIRKLMGEYTDPGTVFIMTVAKQAALKASSEYLTKVRNMGMGTLFFEENDPNRPASASVQIAAEGSDTKSPLNGLYTMPEVAEAMETVNPTYNDVVNLWMKVVGAVRWGKTVGSVKTQLLNFESNLGFAVMNGLLMTGATGKAFNASRKYVAGQYSSKELGEITQKVIQLGLVGQGVNATELAKMLGSGDIHDIALDLAVNPDSKYRMVKKAPGKALGVLNKLYRMGDDFWKVYAYMNERELVAGAMFDKKYTELTDQEKADVDIESSERVKSTWPTYDRVFPAIKTISQNTPIFGNFISFRAESIRVLANTIAMAIKDMKTPGFEGLGARRMAGILSYIAIRTGATYAFAQAVGMAASGLTGLLFGGDDEEERKKRAFKQAAPSFMATQDIAVIPTKEKHKFIVYSLSGIDPYNTTFNTLNALTDGTATMQPGPAAAFTEFFGGFLSPEMTFKTVWAIITNTDPDSGNRIVGKTDEGADAYAKIGAYIFDKLEPSTMTMVQRLAGDNPAAELASLVGARPYEIDLHKSFSFALSDMARQMKEINDEYSFVQFNKKATEDEKALAQKEAEQKKALLIERMNQRFNDFVLIGANPEELRKLIFDRSPIKTTGFDQQTKFGIINGNVNKELLFK